MQFMAAKIVEKALYVCLHSIMVNQGLIHRPAYGSINLALLVGIKPDF